MLFGISIHRNTAVGIPILKPMIAIAVPSLLYCITIPFRMFLFKIS